MKKHARPKRSPCGACRTPKNVFSPATYIIHQRAVLVNTCQHFFHLKMTGSGTWYPVWQRCISRRWRKSLPEGQSLRLADIFQFSLNAGAAAFSVQSTTNPLPCQLRGRTIDRAEPKSRRLPHTTVQNATPISALTPDIQGDNIET